MNTQQINEPALDWTTAIARIAPARAIYEAAGRELDVAERAYGAESVPEPSGMIIYMRGQSFTFEQSQENLKRDWEAWHKHDQELQERFRIDPLETAFADAVDSFVQAVRDAMATPAPDLPALRWKLEQVLDGTVGAALDTKENAAALRADMNRLLA